MRADIQSNGEITEEERHQDMCTWALNEETAMWRSHDQAGSLGEQEEECAELVNLETVVL